MKEYVEAIKTLLESLRDEDRYNILSIALDDIDSNIILDVGEENE